ncbi:hypothetical protein [Leisingera daeponensis]|uniref:hypothetical protein n=1 Tax=Leisingera daeponensis TaxID=405746 RepID=UPI0021BD23BC|nr:hypothetical protein [Leisingera daeponensis]
MNRRDILLGTAASAGALGAGGWGSASAARAQRLTIQPASFAFRDTPTRGW